MADTDLKDELSQLENHLKILSGRLPFINIKKAKKILQQEKKYLKKCRKNYQAEIKRRQEIQLENENETQESLIIQKGVVLKQKEKSEQQSFKKVKELSKKLHAEIQQKKKQKNLLTIQHR